MNLPKSAQVGRGLSVAAFAFFLCVMSAVASAQPSKFEHLKRPQFTELTVIDGISADGSRVIATFRKNPEGFDRPVAWNAAGTPKLLDLLPGPDYAGTKQASYRQPISADGSLIGGYCTTSDTGLGRYGAPPVSWDAAGAIRQLAAPIVSDSSDGFVSAVSPNGAYMYGWCWVPSGGFRPFRWNAAGEATMLQTLSGEDGLYSTPIAATSTDGTIAVGTDDVIIGGFYRNYRPVRWKADGSVEALPLLGTSVDGHAQGEAHLCSGDGSVVLGVLQKFSSSGALLGGPSVCWPGDGRVLELPGTPLAMTPSGRTFVGSHRFDLVNGQIVTTSLGRSSFGVIEANDVSNDGRVMVGGSSARSDEPGAKVWIYNRMHHLEDLLAVRGVSLPAGWKSLDWIYFCSADGKVLVGTGTFGTEFTAFRVTIPDILVDRESPEFVETLAPIRRFCDSGKTFATVTLPTPRATDNFPGKVVVTTTAGPRFPIGTTNVVWTAKDVKGNVARRGQKVIVTNRLPTARAGRDIVVTTRSERGARVNLNGSASTDPDEHALKFKWTAKRVTLAGATSAKASGLFPVGATVATLTVNDAGGGKDADAVRVTVRLRNARQRSSGGAANEAFTAAAGAAGASVSGVAGNSTAASGFAFASIAAGYGDAAGEFVRWEDGQSEADALLSYAELRAVQAAYGNAAASALLSAYAETGDESLLSAYGYSAYGTTYAAADLSEH